MLFDHMPLTIPDSETASTPSSQTRSGPIRRLYQWTLSWAHTPKGPWVMSAVAFTESSFFLIPPDLLLMPLALGKPERAWRFALYCTLASALGGVFGYALGYFLFDAVCQPIIDFYHLEAARLKVEHLYQENNAMIVFIAGFTPIPYKLFTILGGYCKVNLAIFTIASVLSRGTRFFLLAGFCKHYGKQSEALIEKHFKRLVWICTLLVFVAAAVWLLWKKSA